jgi:hypothetical protein
MYHQFNVIHADDESNENDMEIVRYDPDNVCMVRIIIKIKTRVF